MFHRKYNSSDGNMPVMSFVLSAVICLSYSKLIVNFITLVCFCFAILQFSIVNQCKQFLIICTLPFLEIPLIKMIFRKLLFDLFLICKLVQSTGVLYEG